MKILNHLSQFDNNHFEGSITSSYGNMIQLAKFLQGNPACSNASLAQFCESSTTLISHLQSIPSNSIYKCPPESCPNNFEYDSGSLVRCFCFAPLLVGFWLRIRVLCFQVIWMSDVGRVVDLHIPRDKETDKPKGFVFVEYETQEIVDYVVRLFTGLITGQDKANLNLQAPSMSMLTYTSTFKSSLHEDLL
uniref:RRM domain-containing protein n=1 Tax=Lactuca sativa TaxID=4236 RepID=A0A9R1UZC6_LACSA|nr:hypothetical protein LSAT_V11C700363170 [Lactuca sativa]